jgi:hypothetical protein
MVLTGDTPGWGEQLACLTFRATLNSPDWREMYHGGRDSATRNIARFRDSGANLGQLVPSVGGEAGTQILADNSCRLYDQDKFREMVRVLSLQSSQSARLVRHSALTPEFPPSFPHLRPEGRIEHSRQAGGVHESSHQVQDGYRVSCVLQRFATCAECASLDNANGSSTLREGVVSDVSTG